MKAYMLEAADKRVDNVSRRVWSYRCHCVAVKEWIICVVHSLVFIDVFVVMIICICTLSWLSMLTQCVCAMLSMSKVTGCQTRASKQRE